MGWIEVSDEDVKKDGIDGGEWKDEGSFMQYYCEEHGGPMYTVSLSFPFPFFIIWLLIMRVWIVLNHATR